MDLKETMAQMIQEELGDCVEGIRFTGPYEGEEFDSASHYVMNQ